MIQCRQPTRKQLTIGHPLRHSVKDAEVDSARQVHEIVADAAYMTGSEHGETVAQHDPIEVAAVGGATLAPGTADHLGIVAGSGNLKGHRIHGREHVEIEETVVERRDQRVGDEMREPHQVAVLWRRVDDDEIRTSLRSRDGVLEGIELGPLVPVDARSFTAIDADVLGLLQTHSEALGPGTAIVHIVSETALPAIKVDGGHALSGLE